MGKEELVLKYLAEELRITGDNIELDFDGHLCNIDVYNSGCCISTTVNLWDVMAWSISK